METFKYIFARRSFESKTSVRRSLEIHLKSLIKTRRQRNEAVGGTTPLPPHTNKATREKEKQTKHKQSKIITNNTNKGGSRETNKHKTNRRRSGGGGP
jgi:undecaprenyl pyrophosphate synthase